MKESDRNIRIYLQDIADNIACAERFMEEITFDQFKALMKKTDLQQFSALKIIGEAAKPIPSSTRLMYPEIP